MKADRLFTVLVEHCGGTYIGQTTADAPITAARVWLARQSDADLELWQVDRGELQAQLKSDEVVKLNGLAGVWCTTRIHHRNLILFNIVETAT